MANPEKRPKTRRQEYRRGGRGGRDEGGEEGEAEERRRGEEGGRPLKSPDEKQASLHLSRERSLKSISNWWRSSLDTGPTQPTECWG